MEMVRRRRAEIFALPIVGSRRPVANAERRTPNAERRTPTAETPNGW
jgi:hypothetical protein